MSLADPHSCDDCRTSPCRYAPGPCRSEPWEEEQPEPWDDEAAPVHHITAKGTACGADARGLDVQVTTTMRPDAQGELVTCEACREALGIGAREDCEAGDCWPCRACDPRVQP